MINCFTLSPIDGDTISDAQTEAYKLLANPNAWGIVFPEGDRQARQLTAASEELVEAVLDNQADEVAIEAPGDHLDMFDQLIQERLTKMTDDGTIADWFAELTA